MNIDDPPSRMLYDFLRMQKMNQLGMALHRAIPKCNIGYLSLLSPILVKTTTVRELVATGTII